MRTPTPAIRDFRSRVICQVCHYGESCRFLAQRENQVPRLVANGEVADVDVVDEECGLGDEAAGWFLTGA